MQKLISAGHTKKQIMEEYSMAEVRLFYEKIICEEMNDQANFIEGVVAGISGAFGGYDELKPMLKQMRNH